MDIPPLPSNIKIKTFNKEIKPKDPQVEEKPVETKVVEVDEAPEEKEIPKRRETRPIEDGMGEGYIQGRVVIGGDFTPLRNFSSNYVFENEINPNWKTLALREFMDEDEEGAQVDIYHLESQVYLRDGSALYIEKVRIKVAEADGLGGEFFAFIDSSTGEVLHAWDPESQPFDDFQLSEDSFDEGGDDFAPAFSEGIEDESDVSAQ